MHLRWAKLRGEHSCHEKAVKAAHQAAEQRGRKSSTVRRRPANQQFNRVMEQLAPYAAAGLALQRIQRLSALEGQNSALNQYYNSDRV